MVFSSKIFKSKQEREYQKDVDKHKNTVAQGLLPILDSLRNVPDTFLRNASVNETKIIQAYGIIEKSVRIGLQHLGYSEFIPGKLAIPFLLAYVVFHGEFS